jgi:hypothetical protein
MCNFQNQNNGEKERIEGFMEAYKMMEGIYFQTIPKKSSAMMESWTHIFWVTTNIHEFIIGN